MKTKLKTRALVVETRNREVAGGSLWAGRILQQALSFYGGRYDNGENLFRYDGGCREKIALMDIGKAPETESTQKAGPGQDE